MFCLLSRLGELNPYFEGRRLAMKAFCRHLFVTIFISFMCAGLAISASAEKKTTASEVIVVNPDTSPALVRDVDRPAITPQVVEVFFQWNSDNPLGPPKTITPPIPPNGCFVIESVTGEVRNHNGEPIGPVNVYMNIYQNPVPPYENWLYGAQFPTTPWGADRQQVHQLTKLYVGSGRTLVFGFFGAGGEGDASFTISGYIMSSCAVQVTQP
jgi:hypothetical protein